MDETHELNRRWWDEVTPIHVKSPFYDVPGFIAGRSTLGRVEAEALGDVRGKTLLHLQCHFGLDSLSWARLGATVTGVDFSRESIAKAKDLARATNLESSANFICDDVLQLDKVLDEKFDFVFTSHGVLEWLSDINQWGRIIHHFLKPGGAFYILEIHPFCLLFDETDQMELRLANSYSISGTRLRNFNRSDYTDRRYVPSVERTKMLWPLTDIFRALLTPGLLFTDYREFSFASYQHFPSMSKLGDGYWHLPENLPQIPLMFSLQAHKPSF